MASPEAVAPAHARAVLVTGIPRSGTTWLARTLAGARGAALPGKEPMNPRPGQFALGGTVSGWTELDEPSRRQVRLLRRCYRGQEVRTFSRYGVDQWAAALPWSTTIVKDPFALLSVPAIVRVTGAVPVVIYRHPGAVLASYRRMGWTANATEIRRLQGLPPEAPADDVSAMVELWTYLHRRVLDWLPGVPSAVIVSHAEASVGGPAALEAIRRRCGLRSAAKGPSSRRRRSGLRHTAVNQPTAPALHRFERDADEVVHGWRKHLTATEVEDVTSGTAQVWDALENRRLVLL